MTDCTLGNACVSLAPGRGVWAASPVPWPREGLQETHCWEDWRVRTGERSVAHFHGQDKERGPQREGQRATVWGGRRRMWKSRPRRRRWPAALRGGQPQVWEQHAFSGSPPAPINLPWARSGGPGSFPPAPASPRARLEEVPRPPSAVGRTLPPWSQGRSRETRAAAQGRVVLPQHGHGYAHSPQGRDDSKRQPNNLEMLSVWRTRCLSFNMVYYTLI